MYQDSVALMRISSHVSKLPGINQAAVVMGTPQNKNVLKESGLFLPEVQDAKPSDLIIAFDAESKSVASKAVELVDKLMAAPDLDTNSSQPGAKLKYSSIRMAVQEHPEVNMVAISVPGEFAAAEALKALKSNLNVFLFSDNVSLMDEIQLKKYAWRKGLILMGPDCGTAYIDGVPFGFVNQVRRGSIGIVGSSGTGIQEIMTQIHKQGSGISHIIGTGGRDLTDAVEGLSTRSALAALEADDSTDTIILVSKFPSQRVADHILNEFAQCTKKVIACLQGMAPGQRYGKVQFANTLAEAASLATGIEAESCFYGDSDAKAPGRYIRGLFSGGTLANEAYMLLSKELGSIATNAEFMRRESDNMHLILDMGSDEFTRGKPHPIIDLTDRLAMFKKEASNPDVGVILLDVVLGYGAHSNPASELAPYIREFCRPEGPRVVINLLGTDLDVQGYASQAEKLSTAGAVVCNNNYDAVMTALKLVDGAGKGGK
jgi:FdrA protein